MARDGAGNLYIADQGNNRLRRVTPGGTIDTIAGTGVAGFTGDGGAASLAQFQQMNGLASLKGVLYIVDSGAARIRAIQ